MGNVTSQDLLFPDRLATLRPPPTDWFAELHYNDIHSALQFVWEAFKTQDPLRKDKKVWKRQAEVLQVVFSTEWLSMPRREWWVQCWKEWRGLIVQILKGVVTDPHVLDLLHGAKDHLNLHILHVNYLHSVLTVPTLLDLVDTLKPESSAAEWAYTTKRWLRPEWQSADAEHKEAIVGEVQKVVNALAGDRHQGDETLFGNETMFKDVNYAAFPALAELLLKAKRARNGGRPLHIRFLPAENDVPHDPARPRHSRGTLTDGRRDRQERLAKEAKMRDRSRSPARSPVHPPVPVEDDLSRAFNGLNVTPLFQLPPRRDSTRMHSLEHGGSPMGNIPSVALHSVDRLSAIRPPPTEELAHLKSRVIATSLDRVWDAFHQQNPLRDDERVFQRRRAILQKVLRQTWDSLDDAERLGLWRDWRAFLVSIVEGEITTAHSIDLVYDDTVGHFKLLTLRNVYFETVNTPQELLKRIKVLGRNTAAAEWSEDTDRWLRRTYSEAGVSMKMEVVRDLQRLIDDLENGILHGDELQTGLPRHLIAPTTVLDPNSLSLDGLHLAPPGNDHAGKRSRASSSASHRSATGERRLSGLGPWRLDREEEARKEMFDGPKRTRTSSPRRTPPPSPRPLNSLAHHHPFSRRQHLIYQL
ncbi:hypothetical protein JCM11251_000124 [Rhodosporidiobolus azoricus]